MDGPATPESDRAAAKGQRVLACQLCQQRKVKCNRMFPCANCVRAGAQCVPATLVPRQRRRRFPERDLLARIRHYEALLQQHNIQFEPLHPPAPTTETTTGSHGPAQMSTPLTNVGSPDTPQNQLGSSSQDNKPVKPRATNLWRALSRKNPEPGDDDSEDGQDDEDDDTLHRGFVRDDDDMRDVIKKAWDRMYHNPPESNHHILFGSPESAVALTTLHPDQAKIFRLWQIYLDNVNPLLKVTHTPSLQARIVDAISDLSSISAPLEALLFGIYCVAILSLGDDQCQALFGSPKHDLLSGYQFACRQALLNSGLLQTSDHDCLTAFYLYLVSARIDTDPRSLSSKLAVAIHIAQRMGYHIEFDNERLPVLEAEMRRRLWWSLVIFDHRICERFNYRTATMGPAWNCKIPLNVNDFELLPDTKTVPPVHDRPTEALFVFVRSGLFDCIRRCPFYLDFIDPFLTTFVEANNAAGGSAPGGSDRDLLSMQKILEEKMLAFCDPGIPLHFMTTWTARGALAKSLLLEHCSRQQTESSQQQQIQKQEQEQRQDQHNPGIEYAFAMLECDTKLMTSPLMKGFRWYIEFHFPFLAYTYIVQHLKKSAVDDDGWQTARAWELMSDNYEARDMAFSKVNEPLFALFSRVVLRGWEVTSRDDGASGYKREMPRIVASIKRKFAQMKASESVVSGDAAQFVGDDGAAGGLDGRSGPAGMHVFEGVAAGGQPFGAMFPGGFLDMLPGDGMEYMDMDQSWLAMDMELTQRRRW